MNPVITIDRLGFDTAPELLAEQFDGKTTRHFKGNGTSLLPVAGCREVHGVRLPGLIHPDMVENVVPLDTSERPREATLRSPGYRLIEGVDGVPLLQRSRACNDGIWQKGADIYVIGVWDERVSPPSTYPLLAPERPHQPVVLEAGLSEEAAATRGRRGGAVALKEPATKE